MRIVERVRVIFVLMLAIGAAAAAQAAGPATLQVGDANGASATFVSDRGAKAHALVLRTVQAGVAGSRIEVAVDQDKKPVFSHVFAPGECKFGAGGSACEVTISARNAAYRTIVARFRRGREVHVTVQDAGVTRMDQTASLGGFGTSLR